MRETSSRSSSRRAHLPHLPIDHFARPLRPRRRSGLHAQGRKRAADRVQGIAQLVRERGEKFVLAPIGLAQRDLDVLAIGDVGVGADDGAHPAVFIEQRSRAAVYAAHRTVRANQLVFDVLAWQRGAGGFVHRQLFG
jgi:hypothetical protein